MSYYTDSAIRPWLALVVTLLSCGAVSGQPGKTPPMACWFWGAEEFEPAGYRQFIDRYAEHSSAGIITASLRTKGELTDGKVVQQVADAARYATEKGLGLVMDLDVRLARADFKERYPRDLQEIMLLREFPISGTGQSGVAVPLPSFADHYTSGRYPYSPIGVRLVRVYAYEKEAEVIQSETVEDITLQAAWTAGSERLEVSVDVGRSSRLRMACALIAVTLNTPDLFSTNLLGFQREVLQRYANTGLVGAAKDEWGFPGRFHPSSKELWYSDALADAYRADYPDNDLVRDMLLMAMGEAGRIADRDTAINRYMRMCYTRNGEVERDFFDGVKAVFGPNAVVGTHPTWYPYPNEKEIFKNGLSWWQAKRELAQTDEATPFSVRTALTKKWGSAVWYNMFYDASTARYSTEIWRAALGGGRLNIHQPYPSRRKDRAYLLLRDSLFKAIQRIHLLDYISSAPVSSPVAIIFDHTAAINWAHTDRFADVGLSLADRFWEKGIYADLIPSSEVANGSVTLAGDGKVRYGTQRYEAVIYYKPGFDDASVSTLFDRASDFGKTACFRVAGPFDGTEAAVIQLLRQRGIAPQTPGTTMELADFPASVVPGVSGHIRLLDGTYIRASGSGNVVGDPIDERFRIDGNRVRVDAVGVVGVRFDESGKLVALACGGLKSFRTGGVRIDLPERLDVALYKEDGRWRGVIHGENSKVPGDLARFTDDWTFVKQPVPLEN